MTDPMVAFVQARLDEDAAPTAVAAWHEPWCLGRSSGLNSEGTCFYCGAKPDPSNVRLVPQPDRALREVDAKRATIRMYEDALDFVAMMAEHGREASHHVVAAESYLNIIRINAALYDGHPDYLPEWRPPPHLTLSTPIPRPPRPS